MQRTTTDGYGNGDCKPVEFGCREIGSASGAQTTRVLLRAARTDAANWSQQQLAAEKIATDTKANAMTELLHSIMLDEKAKDVVALGTAAVPSTTLEIDSWTITGGTGGLGLAAFEWLKSPSPHSPSTDKGVKTVNLVGRSGRVSSGQSGSTRHTSSVFALESTVLVTMRRADIASTDDADFAHAVHTQSTPDGRGGSTGVLHAGGVLADASLARLTAGATRAVFAPKLRGKALTTQAKNNFNRRGWLLPRAENPLFTTLIHGSDALHPVLHSLCIEASTCGALF